MNKIIRFATGALLFGSIWGFSECIVGDYLRSANLPAGAILTGIFAVGLMGASRILYQQPGMQLGMGTIAALMRALNPFGACILCASIAIFAEAVVFELIWLRLSNDIIRKPHISASTGIITAYTCFAIGCVVTQVLTPLVATSGFYVENLLAFLPQILSRGLIPALLGGIVLPVASILTKVDISKIRSSLYYPATLAISALLWLAVALA